MFYIREMANDNNSYQSANRPIYVSNGRNILIVTTYRGNPNNPEIAARRINGISLFSIDPNTKRFQALHNRIRKTLYPRIR